MARYATLPPNQSIRLMLTPVTGGFNELVRQHCCLSNLVTYTYYEAHDAHIINLHSRLTPQRRPYDSSNLLVLDELPKRALDPDLLNSAETMIPQVGSSVAFGEHEIGYRSRRCAAILGLEELPSGLEMEFLFPSSHAKI